MLICPVATVCCCSEPKNVCVSKHITMSGNSQIPTKVTMNCSVHEPRDNPGRVASVQEGTQLNLDDQCQTVVLLHL